MSLTSAGGSKWWAWRMAWSVFLASVLRATVRRRPATSERISRTSCGGTQTGGSRPAASSWARMRAAFLSVITRALTMAFTSGGWTTVTEPTNGSKRSTICQVLVVISSATASAALSSLRIQPGSSS